ncbi:MULTISPECIES: hypothetical protein [Flavobacterium]|uniref:Beta-carotene 15,15'-monooxygenase n=1 Tax=Flavobacterium algoritolerans TaxID=3041254 RepID=A0ABT6V9Y1_9FLAO|nr:MULTISPECIES: hypothetical protein [Flavobacterium]MDI5888171.1 hypothetical protein [Flavobacterium yafengii]MDI5894605.1 hypothetical protein [Flavobacterium algoritolerans]
MIKTTQDRIEEIKKNGYTLDFGNVFNHAFENYKKIALYGGLMIFVIFVLLSILAFGVVIAIFGSLAVVDFLKPENLKPEEFSLDTLLIFSGISIVISCLLSPLTAALIKMAYCAERDEEFNISTMFEYYKAPYFKEIFIATFLISLISSIFSTIINYTQIPGISFVITVIIELFTILMIPLIIFGKLKALEALEASILIVSKQPLILLGLIVVGSIATLVGLIGCCIGIVFTLPFLNSLYYAIYSEIIGFDSQTEIENRN